MKKKLLLTALISFTCFSLSRAGSHGSAVDVGTAKQLFVDDHVIGSLEGAFRVLNQPVKYEGNPIIELKPAQTVGSDNKVVVMGSVLYDEDESLYKMWYDAANYRWSSVHLAYATSRDGIHWDLPNLGLLEFQGSKDNNLVFFEEGSGEVAGGVFKDPVAKEPQRLYKMIYHTHGTGHGTGRGLESDGNGIGVAFSPDGIHWTRATDKPVIPMADSPNPVLWDARLGKYVAHTRVNPVYYPPDWGTRKDLRDELHPGPEGFFMRREVLQSVSDDFLKWEPRGIIMAADREDPPWNQQFYNMEFMPYGDVYFGFISVYHTLPGMETKVTEGPAWTDTVDIQLTYSRDGRTWHRAGDRQVFLPLGGKEGDFDWSMLYIMQKPLVVKDEIWFYYVGFSGRHWAVNRKEVQGGAVGLAKLRLDGFVSIDAGDGVFTSRPLRMSGDQLMLNADASQGSIRVEILGEDGLPLKGFSTADAVALTGDSVRQNARWKQGGSLARLKGRPIVLRFHMDRSKLFSFQFSN